MYPIGKLPADDLAGLLNKYAPVDPRLIAGGSMGQDVAVIDMGDRYLVAKTDPITFATDEIGWYAVNVNAQRYRLFTGQHLAGFWQHCFYRKIKPLLPWSIASLTKSTLPARV